MQLQAQEQVQGEFAELTRALGSQDATTYQLADEPRPSSPPQKVEDLVQQALNARPELASLQLSRDAAYQFEHAEKDLSYPVVDLMGVGLGSGVFSPVKDGREGLLVRAPMRFW
jgi:outer membrane protein TolC